MKFSILYQHRRSKMEQVRELLSLHVWNSASCVSITRSKTEHVRAVLFSFPKWNSASSLSIIESKTAQVRELFSWHVVWSLGRLTVGGTSGSWSLLVSSLYAVCLQVVEKIRFAPVREASFNILSHMLLSFQHSPQPFHKVGVHCRHF